MGRLFIGGLFIFREGVGILRLGLVRFRFGSFFFEFSRVGLVLEILRLGGGGGSRGFRFFEMKEWVRGTLEKVGFLGVGIGGGG